MTAPRSDSTILDDRFLRCWVLGAGDVASLEQRGITEEGIDGPHHDRGEVRKARVFFMGDSFIFPHDLRRLRPGLFFSPQHGAVSHDEMTAAEAFIIVALDEDGEPLDLVAWDGSERVASLWGRACMLGEQLLPAVAEENEPLIIFRSVEDWLRHERRGVVVLRGHECCARVAFARHGIFSFGTIEGSWHARELGHKLRFPEPQLSLMVMDQACA